MSPSASVSKTPGEDGSSLARPATAHLSAPEIAEALEGEPGPSARGHLTRCSACAHEVESLSDHAAAVRESGTRSSPATRSWDRLLWGLLGRFRIHQASG